MKWRGSRKFIEQPHHFLLCGVTEAGTNTFFATIQVTFGGHSLVLQRGKVPEQRTWDGSDSLCQHEKQSADKRLLGESLSSLLPMTFMAARDGRVWTLTVARSRCTVLPSRSWWWRYPWNSLTERKTRGIDKPRWARLLSRCSGFLPDSRDWMHIQTQTLDVRLIDNSYVRVCLLWPVW